MSAPTITSLAPAGGPTAEGTVVVVTGTALDTVTAAAFGATPAADFAALSATLLVAVAPAGSGIVAFSVTNPDGTSGTLPYQFTDGLFTVAEARALMDSGLLPLADPTKASDAAIIAAEAVVRQRFALACRTQFVPTVITETLDGNATNVLRVSFKNPALEIPRRKLTVSAAAIDDDDLTATELAAVKAHPNGRLVRTDGGSWSSSTGYQDLAVSVTYVYGWSAVPVTIERAALLYCVRILAQGELPLGAERYDDAHVGARFPYPGIRPHWTGDDEVDAILAEFEEDRAVVA